MAITAAEIHNMSFSIDRKGYDVDEVDVFLEHVADEIDEMNKQIAQLESQIDDSRFEGFDTPAHAEPVQTGPSAEELAERDARIADLERQLEAKKADDNAIAQALIIAQRSADEILSNANVQAANTIQDAKDEAQRILDRVEGEKQDVLDAIKKLEDDREDVREEYQELLKDFISDASRKLTEIGGSVSVPAYMTSAHARPADSFAVASASAVDVVENASAVQVPINTEAAASYVVPQASGAVLTPATPTPSAVEKDLSGFGDADDAFEFEEID